MMLLLGVTIAALFATILAGVWRAGFNAGCATAPTCVEAPESALVSAARTQYKAAQARLEFLERVELVAVSEFTVLPWQEVPSPAKQAREQELTDRIQDLEAYLEDVYEWWAATERARSRHWATVKRLRGRVAGMVPVTDFEAVDELRTRSLSVARLAASRAADHAALVADREQAINEITQIEAMDLNAFNQQLELILDQHGIEVGAN